MDIKDHDVDFKLDMPFYECMAYCSMTECGAYVLALDMGYGCWFKGRDIGLFEGELVADPNRQINYVAHIAPGPVATEQATKPTVDGNPPQ